MCFHRRIRTSQKDAGHPSYKQHNSKGQPFHWCSRQLNSCMQDLSLYLDPIPPSMGGSNTVSHFPQLRTSKTLSPGLHPVLTRLPRALRASPTAMISKAFRKCGNSASCVPPFQRACNGASIRMTSQEAAPKVVGLLVKARTSRGI